MHNKPHTEETKQKIREHNLLHPRRYWKGKKLPEHVREAQRKSVTGNKWLVGKHWKNSKEFKEKARQRFLGEKNPRWKGGITPLNQQIRHTPEYKLWREAVFKRDNWTCFWCGFKGYVEADHIKPFAYFPELRFAIDNGRTLCRPCHITTGNFGRRKEELRLLS